MDVNIWCRVVYLRQLANLTQNILHKVWTEQAEVACPALAVVSSVALQQQQPYRVTVRPL